MQGSFTPTFSRNRAWNSRFTRLFLLNHKDNNLFVLYKQFKFFGWPTSNAKVSCDFVCNIINRPSRLLTVLKPSKLTPSLRLHYRGFITTTNQSATEISQNPSVYAFYVTISISRVPYKSLNKSPAVFIPDAALSVIKSSLVLSFPTSFVLSRFWHRLL